MAVPKIGTVKFTQEKSDVLKIADDLAAKSRILRRAADAHDAVLDRLRQLGDEAASDDSQREQAIRSEQVDEIKPLIEKAHELVAAGDEARGEAKPLLQALTVVNFDALRKKFSSSHGMTLKTEAEIAASPGSAFYADSTQHRIARLQAAVKDLQEFVTAGDSELRAWMTLAESLTEVTRGSSIQAVNELRRCLAYGGSAEGTRGKLAGIRRLLSDIGEDILSPDGVVPAAGGK
jgi:hypothetical protein